MPIQLRCPDCSAKIRAPDTIIGRQVRCPKCDAEFTAVDDSPAAGPAAPEVPDHSSPVYPSVAPPERKEVPPPSRIEEPATDSAPETDDEGEETRTPEQVTSVPPGGAQNPIVDFLLFRTMIAPLIIQIIFWIGVLTFVVGGLVNLVLAVMVIADGREVRLGVGWAFASLGTIFVGPLLVRIYCELFILLFRMYDTLRELLVALEKERRQG